MRLIEKGLFEERNRKYNYSSTRSGSLYKEYEENGAWRER